MAAAQIRQSLNAPQQPVSLAQMRVEVDPELMDTDFGPALRFRVAGQVRDGVDVADALAFIGSHAQSLVIDEAQLRMVAGGRASLAVTGLAPVRLDEAEDQDG